MFCLWQETGSGIRLGKNEILLLASAADHHALPKHVQGYRYSLLRYYVYIDVRVADMLVVGNW